MKVLVTGASGFLGNYLVKYAPQSINLFAQSRDIKKYQFSCTPVNFTLQEPHLIEKINNIAPNVIIHTAAMANVDECEVKKEEAYKVNVNATKLIAEYAGKNNCKLVFTSTDQVYDGEKSLYNEEYKCNPVNYYGLTKLEAEKSIKKYSENFAILRCALFYGKAIGGRISFTEVIYNKLKNQEKVNAFCDQYRSPVWVEDLAKTVWYVALNNIKGIFNIGGSQKYSRLQMAKLLAKNYNLDENLIIPVKSTDVKLQAPRGLDCSLNSQKILSLLDFDFKLFKDGINFSYLL